MAQGRVARGPPAADYPLTNIAEDQRHAFQQYGKIMRFHDKVISGNHSTIKPPAHFISSAKSPVHPANSAASAIAPNDHLKNFQSFPVANGQKEGLPAGSFRATAPTSTPAVAKPFGSGNTEINPILLEKSDDLIKAELLLQRQRLERALREDVEQRRAAAKTAAQGEPLADFDLSDVLSKALTLVQATAAPLPVNENVTAANQDAASDSFDDNTFYSSQHDTPESNLTSRVRNESQEAQAPIAINLGQSSNPQPTAPNLNRRIDVVPGNLEPTRRPYQSPLNTSTNTIGYSTESAPRLGQVPGLSSYIKESAVSSGLSQNTSGQQSQSDESGNTEIVQQGLAYRQSYADNHPPSPLIRAHELSPVAPQPSRVSPLKVTTRLPLAGGPVSNQSSGTPAQVVALRNDPAAATSPESSPSGGKASDKKKTKKKKRKADRQVPEAETTPYIKPEPRSPSPMSAPAYIRPNKRQRYSQRPSNEPRFVEEPRYEAQPSAIKPQAYPARPQRDERIPIAYEGASVYPQRAASTVMASGPSYGREYIDDRRIAEDPYVVQQPATYATPEGVIWRSTDPAHGGRTPVRVQDQYGQSPRSYRGAYEPPRMSVRPDEESFIGPPRQPPTRIVVDAFGREYIEPPRPTVIRHSAAPPVRPDDPEIIYERPAPRAISRHVGVGSYEDGATIYRRSPPQYAMSRRVVTQPEYISQEYRESRQQEYSTRPMAPPGEYVEVVAPPERRHLEPAPRDFIARAASVRPTEPVRYEVPRDYGRVQSVRPEIPVRQYAASVHPESRREAALPYMRDYGARPVEQPVVRREYGMRPVEQYYDQRGGEEIAFIERPRGATQEIVYADDARREVYR
ncbi:Fc.00g089060.m01.CDS01 [Cosmosporella sp. VM-42]